MLTAREVGYEIGNHDVFANVNLSVSNGDKVGLIGPNGAGKTTLLHLLNGDMAPTTGEILRENVEVGMLPQDLRDRHDQTVYDFIEEVTGVKDVKDTFSKAEESYNGNPDNQDALVTYVDAAERLGFFAVDEFDATMAKSLRRAGLDEDIAAKEIGQLSGGQRTRVALAAIMATRYDVVLLDEPTNNLDMEGMAILERYITASRAAFLMVSHDRRFLRNATSRIVEILGGKQGVNNYGLGYDEYVDARIHAYETESRRYAEHAVAVKALQSSIRDKKVQANSAERGGGRRTDNDKLGANHRAGRAAGHLGKQANALETRLEQLVADTPNKPQEPVTLDFLFGESESTTQTLVSVKDLSVAYNTEDGEQLIMGPYNLDVRGSDRLAIVGPNGSGKSTLVKAIVGAEKPYGGSRRIGSGARVAYIDQNQTLPNPQATPLANLLELSPGLEHSEAMHLLVKFNLNRDTVQSMRAENLSGGERAKVLLASVAAKKANLLILDEPTNNLDIPTIEGLQEALSTYTGAIILVSHDRDFIDGIGINRTLELG